MTRIDTVPPFQQAAQDRRRAAMWAAQHTTLDADGQESFGRWYARHCRLRLEFCKVGDIAGFFSAYENGLRP